MLLLIMSETLILTATIAPSKYVIQSPKQKYRSTSLQAKEREKEYYKAIKYYLEHSNFNTLIFCDNSNYNFTYVEELKSIAMKQGKILEFLKFQGDITLATQISYGAGEAEIFDYIYEHSKEIKKSTSRFKITGRYIIENINEIIKKTKNIKCYFNKYGIRCTPFHVATAVLKISNEVYEKYLYQKQINVYKLLKSYEDDTLIQLEQVRYILLRDYILNNYIKQDIPHIPVIISHMTYNRNKFLLFLFRMGVKIGLLDFNCLYKLIDSLFLSKAKKEIIKKIQQQL